MKRNSGNRLAAVQVAQLLPYWLHALLMDSASRWALVLNIFCLIWLRPPGHGRHAQPIPAGHDEKSLPSAVRGHIRRRILQ